VTNKANILELALVWCLFAGLGVASGFAQDRGVSKQSEWPCGGDPNLLVDQGGAPVWIGSDELRVHAVNAPVPTTPAPFRTSARIIVDVLIDPLGHVKCVRIESGHPVLKLAAAQTAVQWTFKPFSADGHPVSVYGHLDFDFGQPGTTSGPAKQD
jgi:hypothetical protein